MQSHWGPGFISILSLEGQFCPLQVASWESVFPFPTVPVTSSLPCCSCSIWPQRSLFPRVAAALVAQKPPAPSGIGWP